jgi:hypothetical protein
MRYPIDFWLAMEWRCLVRLGEFLTVWWEWRRRFIENGKEIYDDWHEKQN